MKVYKLKQKEGQGLLRVSFVNEPAIQTELMAFNEEKEGLECFYDEEKREIFAPALIPKKLIVRKEVNGEPAFVYFDEETIKQLHISGCRVGYDNQINLNHEEKNTQGVFCFESWIVIDSKNDKSNAMGFDVREGTLMKGYKIDNPDTWAKIKSGEIKGLSIEAYLDKELDPVNQLEPKTKKTEMNKKSIFEHVKSLFVADDSKEYASGVYGKSLEEGSIVTDAEGNALPNKEFEFEGKKYKTDDMGAIASIEEMEAEPNEEAQKVADLEAKVSELEAENNDLKAKLTEWEAKGKEAEAMSSEVESLKGNITKLEAEVIEAKKISAMPNSEPKAYEDMTRKEKLEFNRENR